MFKVPIDKIIPVTSARAKIASLVNDVQDEKSLYVLTRSGKPAAILSSLDYFTKHSNLKLDKKEQQDTQIVQQKSTEELPVVKDEVSNDVVEADSSSNVPSKDYNDEQPVEISIN